MYKTEEEAIAAAKAEMGEDDLIEFAGGEDEGCDSNGCRGWNGRDNRCDCGNHRVYWTALQNGDGTFTAYAMSD